MAFYGMDTEQVLGQSDALEQAARRLEDVLGGLHRSVQGTAWAGPDAEAFREQWETTRQQGERTVLPGLGDRARELQQHAEEQDRASEVGDGGALEEAMDWLRETGGDIVDGVAEGIDWLGDRVVDGMDRLDDRAQDGRDLISTAVDAIRDVEWPRFTEFLVDGASGLMHGANGLFVGLTGIDLKLADDGTGYADAPVAVTPEQSGLVAPADLSQIIANTNRTYGTEETGEVSMSVVGNPPTGVIVNIPGTERWWPNAGDNPLDLTGNAAQAGSDGWSAGAQATADAIEQLYAAGHIPPGTPLMLNGHSQGGMIATSLAADEEFVSQYHLTNVMTYGSPVDNYEVPAGVHQLNIQHGGDLVPLIDAEGSHMGPIVPGPGGIPLPVPIPNPGAGSATTVTLDSPSLDPLTNHSGGEYQNSVQTALQDPDSQLSQYSSDPSLQPFLSGDPDSVQHFISELHREN